MNYLAHIERAAENLQFYLWFRDYCKRFAEIPQTERVLAPEWSAAQHHENESGSAKPVKMSADTLALLQKANPATSVSDLPASAGLDIDDDASAMDASTLTGYSGYGASSHATSYAQRAAQAFEDADVKFQPCTSLSLSLSLSHVTQSNGPDG